jgi:hypothetical protein
MLLRFGIDVGGKAEVLSLVVGLQREFPPRTVAAPPLADERASQ